MRQFATSIGFLALLLAGLTSASAAAPRTAYVMYAPYRIGADPATGLVYTPYPLHWRYGYWGGSGWTNGQVNPRSHDPQGKVADPMDALFRAHDNEYAMASAMLPILRQMARRAADARLLAGLGCLPNYSHATWGRIYRAEPEGAPVRDVIMTRGGKKVSMPFSEYARLQAIAGFRAKSFAPL